MLKQYLITFFISMVPIIELRGAIPIGVGLGLSYFEAFVCSFLGNILPVPIIILFVLKVFAWMRKVSTKLDNIVTKLENRLVESAGAMIHRLWALHERPSGVSVIARRDPSVVSFP